MKPRKHPNYVKIFSDAKEMFYKAPCNGAKARAASKDFRPCDPYSELATHFDPVGAVMRAAGPGPEGIAALRYVHDKATPKGFRDISQWCDQPWCQPLDVFHWFDSLIEQARLMYPPTTIVYYGPIPMYDATAPST